MRNEDLDVFTIDPYELDDQLREFLVAQSQKRGFRLTEWCRAPEKCDDSLSDAKIRHVVYCLPERTCRIKFSLTN